MRVLFYGVKGNYREAKDYLLNKGFILVNEYAQDIDLIISYLYNKKIPLYMLNCAKVGAINFHPAPLPEYRNSRTYPFAILEERTDFAVTCHYMNQNFDTGEIIRTLTFPIKHASETCLSLKLKCYDYLFILFRKVIDYLLENNSLPKSYKQDESKAQSCTLEELEKMKLVDLNNISAKELKKQIRAFWHPHHHTAKVVIDGEEFSLVSKEMIKEFVLDEDNYLKRTNWVFAEGRPGIIVNPTKEAKSLE